jgi:hypothetical protein
MTASKSPHFTIEARPVKLPQAERARRLAAVYDLLLAKAAERPKNGQERPSTGKGGGNGR